MTQAKSPYNTGTQAAPVQLQKSWGESSCWDA